MSSESDHRAAPATEAEDAPLLSFGEEDTSSAEPTPQAPSAAPGAALGAAPDASVPDGGATNDDATPARRPRVIYRLTWASIFFSLGVIGPWIAIEDFLSRKRRFWFDVYSSEEAAKQLLLTGFFSAVWSGFNAWRLYRHNKALWLGPNVFVDMALVFAFVNATFRGANFLHISCRNVYDNDLDLCLRQAGELRIMFIVIFVLGGLLTVVHTWLAVLRWIQVYSNRRGFSASGNRNGGSVFLPGGQFTIELSFRMLRQSPDNSASRDPERGQTQAS